MLSGSENYIVLIVELERELNFILEIYKLYYVDRFQVYITLNLRMHSLDSKYIISNPY